MTNTTLKRVAIGAGVLVGICGAAGLALYLAAVIFLVVNKINPMHAHWLSFLTYWNAYSGDTQLHKRLSGSLIAACGLCFVVAPLAIAASLRRDRPLHGDSKFATPLQVRRSGLLGGDGPRIIVGKWRKWFLALGGQLFVLLAAPTRSGKGVGVIIPNLLSWPHSVVVLDIKLENFLLTSGFRAKHGQEVYLFAPFDENGRTHCINPLDRVRPDRRYRVGDLQAIGKVLYPGPREDGGDSTARFFADKARDLFLGLGLLVLETPTLSLTFGELLRQSGGNGKPLQEYLEAAISDREKSGVPLSDDCVNALDRFVQIKGNTGEGILATFNAPLSIFADPIVDAATSRSDFSLADPRRRLMSIYIHIPKEKVDVAGLLVNLLFTQLIDLNTQQLPKDNPELIYQCLLVLDEMTVPGPIRPLAKGVGFIAGYGLRFLTIINSMAQLAACYRDDAKNLATNHALHVLFAPQEQSDAEELSRMLGTFTQAVESKGRSRQLGQRAGSSVSTNVSQQRRPLMLPQELRELGTEREIVLLENTRPILAEKIRYYSDPVFKSRLFPPASLPTVNVDLHRARIERRTRPAVPADLEGGLDLSRLAHDFENLPEVTANAGPEAVSAFVDAFFSQLSTDDAPPAAPKAREAGSDRKMNSVELSSGAPALADRGDALLDLAQLETER